MTDLERLRQAGTDVEKGLLTAGREEQPSEQALERTLVTLGIGAAAAGTGAAIGSALSSSAALKAGGTGSLLGLTLKWLGLGATGGLLAMGAMTGVERLTGPPRAPNAVVTPAASRGVPEAPRAVLRPPPEAPQAEKPEPPKPLVQNGPPPNAALVPSGEPSIAEELRALDDARSALSSGNNAKVIAILDGYDKRPGPHRLGQESQYLRMEALSRAGYTAAAQVAAKGLLATSPGGPHAARAREILGGDKK